MDNHGPLDERVTRLEEAVFGPPISPWRRVRRIIFGIGTGAVTLFGFLTLLDFLIGIHEAVGFVVGTVILAGFLASFFYMVLKFEQFSKRHPDWAAVVTGAALGGLAESIGLLYFQAVEINPDLAPLIGRITVVGGVVILAAWDLELAWWYIRSRRTR